MCGRYVSPNEKHIRDAFAISEDDHQIGLDFNYNASPGQYLPIIKADVRGRHMLLSRWGFVAPWSKGMKPGSVLINARAETVMEKPM